MQEGALRSFLTGRPNPETGPIRDKFNRGGLSWRFKIMASFFAAMDGKKAWRKQHSS